jgi:hypothetical protein
VLCANSDPLVCENLPCISGIEPDGWINERFSTYIRSIHSGLISSVSSFIDDWLVNTFDFWGGILDVPQVQP